jgi:molybdenum cofactor cytidylyltransferase
MAQPCILILAAGASARMAPRDKLLEPVAGQPLLRRVVQRALDAGVPVVVVLPPDRPLRAAALAGLAVATVVAADANRGMAASLRAGMAALPMGATGVMILPADMPAITAQDLRQMIARHEAAPDRLLRGATAAGREGHPALFPADLFGALAAVTGDEGGRSVLAAHRDRVEHIALPGDHAVLDLDTPEDWAAYRASGGQ